MACKYKYNDKWFTENELIYLIGEKKNLLDISNKQALERLNSLQEIFKQSPELQSIGTIFDYDSYLDTIFPDSKVKDIVYHATVKPFEDFDNNMATMTSKDIGQGLYFADKKNIKSWQEYQNRNRWKAVSLHKRLLIDAAQNKIDNWRKTASEEELKKLEEYMNNKSPLDFLESNSSEPILEAIYNYIFPNEIFNIEPSDILETAILIPLLVNAKELLIIKQDPYLVFIENKIPKETDVVIEGSLKDIKQGVVYNNNNYHMLGSKQDIEGFKEFINKQKENNIQLQDLSNNQVNYTLKVISIISNNLSTVNRWFKQLDNTDLFWNKVQQKLQIPKEQLELLKNSEGNTIEEKLLNFASKYSYVIEINTAKYISNIYKNSQNDFQIKDEYDNWIRYIFDGKTYRKDYASKYPNINIIISKDEFDTAKRKYIEDHTENSQHYADLTVPGGTNYTENEIATPLITPYIKGHAKFSTDKGIGWFRSDDLAQDNIEKERMIKQQYDELKPEGITYEQYKLVKSVEIGGIVESSKTRRILEVQSELFQKGRDSDDLVTKQAKSSLDTFSTNMFNLNRALDEGRISLEEYRKERNILEYNQKLREKFRNLSDNQFLQLLNKDNNWVSFFIKSVMQDTAKQTITEVQESDVEAKVKELEKEGLLEINCI